MIEIAIAVGVIGFALVAIIGILPRGMGVQKDNREDTIISQDAPYFLNAIRNGEQRITNNILANYVETIVVTNFSQTGVTVTTNLNTNLVSGAYNGLGLTYDSNIVGFLSTPEVDVRVPNQTNQVSAIVRAMTGSAVQQNGANSLTAFRYQLTVEIDPWNFATPDYNSHYTPYGTSSGYSQAQLNYLSTSLYEIRLRFAWPVFPNGTVGPGRQT